jgi:hypothetical protein
MRIIRGERGFGKWDDGNCRHGIFEGAFRLYDITSSLDMLWRPVYAWRAMICIFFATDFNVMSHCIPWILTASLIWMFFFGGVALM